MDGNFSNGFFINVVMAGILLLALASALSGQKILALCLFLGSFFLLVAQFIDTFKNLVKERGVY